MQISTLAPGSLGPATTGIESVSSVPRVDGTAPGTTPEALAPTASAPLRPAGPNAPALPPQLNQQISRGQMAMRYLSTLDSQLTALKRDISAQLGLPTPDKQLASQIAALGQTWQQRASASQGSLDAQLNFNALGDSRQTFQIQGLDNRSLQRSDKETLSFTVGSGLATGRIVTAVLEADQPAETRLRILDQALAVADVRVSRNALGEPVLSTPESNWPALQDSLGVRGGGIRFPAKQFHRVRIEPEAPAIRPETWSVADSTDLRLTLQQVLQAQAAIHRSQAQVGRTLSQLSDAMGKQPPKMSPEQAQAFARDFQRIGEQPTYLLVGAVAPAVVGVSRQRVDRLLALGDAPLGTAGT